MLFIIGLIGCVATTDAPRTPDYFATDFDLHTPKIKKIALVTSLTPPEIESVDLGVTLGEGAASGAAGGALRGASLNLSLVAEGAAAGSAGGAVMILLLPVFVLVGAIAGTASGVAVGYSADTLAEAEANARHMLNSAYLQTELLEHAQEYGLDNTDLDFIRIPDADSETLANKPDYKALSNDSIDAVLEVELRRFSLEYSLEIDVRARLISTRTGAVLSDGHYKFLSERHKLKEWITDGAAPLTEAIQRGLRKLAEDVVDENFLLFYPNESEEIIPQQIDETSDQVQEPQEAPVPHYVLSPVYPALDLCFFCSTHAMGLREFVLVDSVQPTLQWESFPRAHDLTDSGGQEQQITDVRYELRVFNTTTPPSGHDSLLIPAQQVYSARNISDPYHKIENKLDICSDYFWTVRARFKLDGRYRVTEWAGAFNIIGWNEKPWNLRHGLHNYKSWAVGITADGPEWFYYSFRTPCGSEKALEFTNPEQDDEEF